MDYPLGVMDSREKAMKYSDVLIPILMDYPLGASKAWRCRLSRMSVLIPILMDYPLGDLQRSNFRPQPPLS